MATDLLPSGSSGLQVDIVTPTKEVFSGFAAEVRVPGWEGEFGVLPGHDIVMSLLRCGVCTIVASGTEKKFVIGRGFVEAGPDRVTVLTEKCVPAQEIDRGKANADLVAAENDFAKADYESAEWRNAEERMEFALASCSL